MTGLRREPASRARQIQAFFEANPGEYLTLDDVATRFNCTTAQAKHALRWLQKQGTTTSAHHHFLNPDRPRDDAR